jgi:uncharacterized protein YndB with AHSA1/START domain
MASICDSSQDSEIEINSTDCSEAVLSNTASAGDSAKSYELFVDNNVTYINETPPLVTNRSDRPQVELGLQVGQGMDKQYSQLTSTVEQPKGRSNRSISGLLATSPWNINLECRLAADMGRIFNALTIPEYIEAWICLPGCPTECWNSTRRIADGFQIEHQCHSGAVTTVNCAYVSLLKRKLSFLWRPTGALEMTESLVDIRLRGDFECSILRLRHSGFASEEEFEWHSDLWAGSLTKLSKMFSGSVKGADIRELRVRRQQSGELCEV